MEVVSPAIRHERLVKKIISLYFLDLTEKGYDFEDLVQEGLIAVLRAAPGYDAARAKESTYYASAVYHWIKSRIIQYNSRKCRYANFNTISLDALRASNISPYYDQDEPSRISGFSALMDRSVDIEARALDNVILAHLMQRLEQKSAKQAKAVRLYYLYGMKDSDVGRVMRCSRQRAHAMMQDGIRNLRKYAQELQGGQTA